MNTFTMNTYTVTFHMAGRYPVTLLPSYPRTAPFAPPPLPCLPRLHARTIISIERARIKTIVTAPRLLIVKTT